MHIEYIFSVGTLKSTAKLVRPTVEERQQKKKTSERARRRHPIYKWKEMVYFFARFSCVYRRSRQSMCTIDRPYVCLCVCECVCVSDAIALSLSTNDEQTKKNTGYCSRLLLLAMQTWWWRWWCMEHAYTKLNVLLLLFLWCYSFLVTFFFISLSSLLQFRV